MKTIFGLLLTVCTLAAQSLSDPAFVASLTVPSGVAACATTDTTVPHDTFLEGFQTATIGVNDGNTWVTNMIGTTANIDPYFDISAYTSGKVAGSCDRGYKLTVPNSTETYIAWTNSVEIDNDAGDIDVRFQFYIETITLSDTESHSIYMSVDDGGQFQGLLMLRNNAGTFELFYDSTVDSAPLPVSEDTWHEVWLHHDSTAAQSFLELDNAYSQTNLFTRIANADMTVLRLGAPSNLDASDGGAVLLFDLLCVNTP